MSAHGADMSAAISPGPAKVADMMIPGSVVSPGSGKARAKMAASGPPIET